MASSSRRPYLSRSRRKAGFIRLIRRLSVYESLEARSLLSAAPTLNAQAYVALSLAESPAVKVDSARSLSSDLAPANSAPTADNLVVYTVEDAEFTASPLVVAGGAATVSPSVLELADPDSPATEFVYRLTQEPEHGHLELRGTVVARDQVFSQQDVVDGELLYVPDAGNSASDSFGLELVQSKPHSTIEHISVTADGSPLNGDVLTPVISRDGSVIAF